MAFEIKMPKFGETMTEGIIASWLKEEGDVVEKGEVIFEVETDKSILEVEAEESGILKKILLAENEEAPIGTVIGIIADEDEEIPSSFSKNISDQKLSQENKEKYDEEDKYEKEGNEKEINENLEVSGENIRSIQINSEINKTPATPAARRIAREKGIELDKINESGIEGNIKKEDVLNFVQEQRETVLTADYQPLAGIRKITADRMTESSREVPHVTLATKINMTEIIKNYEDIKATVSRLYDRQITITDIITKATAITLASHDNINAHFSDNSLIKFGEVNIGLAVALEDGLIVPVIKEVNKLSLTEISTQREELVKKARSGSLTPTELNGATFTITNLGTYGIDHFTPIINIPEVAILGIGQIKKEAVVIKDEIKICSMMAASLSFDHRANDGAMAASFLNDLKDNLEDLFAIFV